MEKKCFRFEIENPFCLEIDREENNIVYVTFSRAGESFTLPIAKEGWESMINNKRVTSIQQNECIGYKI